MNLAARLLGVAGEHRLLLSASAQAALADAGATPVADLTLRNIDGPVAAFALDLAPGAPAAA